MFKSITYLNYTHDSKAGKYIYKYHLVDSDFECDISAAPAAAEEGGAVRRAVEYHKRGLDVVRNIYLLIVYIQKEWYNSWSFMDILDWQNKHIDENHPIDGLSFSKDIYPKVKELYETLNTYK